MLRRPADCRTFAMHRADASPDRREPGRSPTSHARRGLTAAVAIFAVLTAACSSDGDDRSARSTAAAPSTSAAPAGSVVDLPTDATDGPTGTAGPTDTTEAPATTDAPTATDAPTTTEAPPTTEAPTTTVDVAALAATLGNPGPYPVGVTTATLPNGIAVEIWYPAVAGSVGTDTYDVRDFTAPAIKALLTADIPATFTTNAARDAAVETGHWPVVLSSHGYSAMRLASSFLTTHLASWGMIVVAPDHPTRDLYHAVAGLQPDVVTEPADDLLGALDLIVARSTTAGDPFEGRVDAGRVGAVGHSAGGGTVLRASLDDRIDGYVSMASGIPQEVGAVESPVLPAKPSLFMAGSLDGVADPARTRAAFDLVPPPSWFWQIEGAGHNAFDDFCTFGNGSGIIGIAEASGLGAFLDAQAQFRALGEDGCVPPAIPVATTFPIVDHAVTAFFVQLFGGDETITGADARAALGPDVAAAFATPVVIESR